MVFKTVSGCFSLANIFVGSILAAVLFECLWPDILVCWFLELMSLS